MGVKVHGMLYVNRWSILACCIKSNDGDMNSIQTMSIPFDVKSMKCPLHHLQAHCLYQIYLQLAQQVYFVSRQLQRASPFGHFEMS